MQWGSFANSCVHREGCCPLFSLSLLPTLSLHPFAMNVAQAPGINSSQGMPRKKLHYWLCQIILFCQVGAFKWFERLSNSRQKTTNKQTNENGKKPKSVWQREEMGRSRQGTRTLKSKPALQHAQCVIWICVLGCLIPRQKKVHRKEKTQQVMTGDSRCQASPQISILICAEEWGQTPFLMFTGFGAIEIPLQPCPNTKSFPWWFSAP